MDASSLESARVLVLNSSYEPLRIVGWRRAILLMLGQKIDILDAYNIAVRSISQSFQVPAVVKMKRYVRPKKPFSYVRFSRQHVFVRDDHRCMYCDIAFHEKDLTLDHVIPVVRGGRATWSNIVTSCVPCNQRKGSKTPQEAGLSLRETPAEPQAGFLPDLLLYQTQMPDSWKAYLNLQSRGL